MASVMPSTRSPARDNLEDKLLALLGHGIPLVRKMKPVGCRMNPIALSKVFKWSGDMDPG
jgi:hypothetical protein